MSKKSTKKQKEEDTVKAVETIKTEEQELYTLVDLVRNTTVHDTWVIYNLSRMGLMEQYEQELENYNKKEITPTITIEEFVNIITGKQ